MPSQMPPATQARIAAIAADREHGASWLARAALDAVAGCASESRQRSVAGALAELRRCIAALIAARPGMAAVRNRLEQLRAEIEAAAPTARDGATLLRLAGARARQLAAAAEAAERRAAEQAAVLLQPGEVVMTASASGTVLAALQLAGPRLRRVLAAESRRPDGPGYGLSVVQQLRAAGSAAEVVPDEALEVRVGEATRVLLGADTVLRNGSLINGAPSLALARAAHRAGVPLVAVFDSTKLDRWSDPERAEVPAGFERVPAALVGSYVTEAGPHTWEALWAAASRHPTTAPPSSGPLITC